MQEDLATPTSADATTIVDRAELAQKTPPLASERWAGAIDSIGGQTLATVLATTASYGSVASCGLAGGACWGLPRSWRHVKSLDL